MDTRTRVIQKCNTTPFPTMSKWQHPKMNPKHWTTMKKWTMTFLGMITTLKSTNASGLCKELGIVIFMLFYLISRTSASPSASGPDSEHLPSPERERRQALEYEEEDAPPEISVEVKEAHVSFPNLPVPKSSDGNVRPRLIINPFDSFLLIRTGSSGSRATSS